MKFVVMIEKMKLAKNFNTNLVIYWKYAVLKYKGVDSPQWITNLFFRVFTDI